MATRLVTCYIAVCDLCGTTTDADGFTPHLDSAEEAVRYITETAFGDSGWTLSPDGLLVCDTVTDDAHEAVHEKAGKRIPAPGPDAMCVTFPTTRPDHDETRNAA
ncbi:hypothetical protein QFW82_20835 [Streptomyces malaysiensis subsp. malaysiensis]|uniref:hypothetical protein n=1 Tax=Streptomyces malaysiensis TaxID=92644 RepID=UPI0024C0E02E|nr:hypothetical protein [Streptomyces sp. NA07423]WHX19326.1 hypothetical protein QFW82_20835 [Streptomyces sp. NA07423]